MIPWQKNPLTPKLALFLNPHRWGRRPRLRRPPRSVSPPLPLSRSQKNPLILKLASFLNPLPPPVGRPILAAAAFQAALVPVENLASGNPEPLRFPRQPPDFRIGTDPQAGFVFCNGGMALRRGARARPEFSLPVKRLVLSCNTGEAAAITEQHSMAFRIASLLKPAAVLGVGNGIAPLLESLASCGVAGIAHA